MGLHLKFIYSVLITFASLSTVQAHTIGSQEYAFPIKDPYKATLSAAIDHPLVQPQIISLVPRPERATVPLFEGRNNVFIGLYAQPKPAPLVFVIPGIGGDATSGEVEMLAEELFHLGYHAVTLPNPISWSYTLGVSESTLPGFMARDIPEYYLFMQMVSAQLKKQKMLQVQGYAVAGYSWGGLLVGFLLQEDLTRKVLNFKKALMINPALDLSVGIATLDQLESIGQSIPADQKDSIMAKLFSLASELLMKPLQDALKALAGDLGIPQPALQWVIGDSFHQSISDVIFTSQQIKDRGILHIPASRLSREAREAEARRFSFADYLNVFVTPSLTPSESGGDTQEQLLRKQSIYGLANLLQNDSRLFVMDNLDDLIADPDALDFLNSTVADERIYLYPNGGHCGNLWFGKNQDDLRTIMTW